MKPSALAVIEQADVRMDGEWRLIALPGDAYTPLKRSGSPWLEFPLPGDRILLCIANHNYAVLLLDLVTRELQGHKTGDLETLLLRRLSHPGEIAAHTEVARIGLAQDPA